MKLEEMQPDKLAKVSDEELRLAHLRLHQWYAQRKEKRINREAIINAHIFVVREMLKRGMRHNIHDELDRESRKLEQLRKERVFPAIKLNETALEQFKLGELKELKFPDDSYIPYIGTPLLVVGSRAGQQYIYGELILASRENPVKVKIQRIYDEPQPIKLVPEADVRLVVKTMPPEVVSALDEIRDLVVIPDFCSLSGSALAPDKKPEDIDIIWRAEVTEDGFLKIPITAFFLKFERSMPAKLQEKFHHVANPSGPTWSYIPMFDLVLRRKPVLQPVILDESYAYHKAAFTPQPLKPFTPMKAREGYHKHEFFKGDEELLWDTWASGYIDRGIAVDAKADGMRIVIHKKGDTVKMFTEDAKRDRAFIFPEVVSAVKRIKGDVILDAEFVAYKDGKPLRRENMIWMIVGKKPPEDQEVRVYVHDCLYWDKPLHESPYVERRKYVARAVKQAGPPLYEMPFKVVHNKKDFMQALKWATALPFSEGAMLKVADSTYRLDVSRTVEWAKYKNFVEVTVKIIGMMKKANPLTPEQRQRAVEHPLEVYREAQKNSRTYIFRCAILKEGKLVPLESQVILTPGEMQLRYDAARKQWKGLEDPRLWTMMKGFPEKKPGDYAYGNTYGKSYKDVNPKLGMQLTVLTAQLFEFKGKDGKTHLSWMHPIPKELKPEVSKPDSYEELKAIISRGKVRGRGVKENGSEG